MGRPKTLKNPKPYNLRLEAEHVEVLRQWAKLNRTTASSAARYAINLLAIDLRSRGEKTG